MKIFIYWIIIGCIGTIMLNVRMKSRDISISGTVYNVCRKMNVLHKFNKANHLVQFLMIIIFGQFAFFGRLKNIVKKIFYHLTKHGRLIRVKKRINRLHPEFSQKETVRWMKTIFGSFKEYRLQVLMHKQDVLENKIVDILKEW